MVTIRNETPEEIVMIDHYLTDVKLNNGYDGVIEHRIAAKGKKCISSAKYVHQLMEEKKPQQIHVRSGGKTKRVLHHYNLNDDKEVVFKMEGSSIIVTGVSNSAARMAVAERGASDSAEGIVGAEG